MPDDAQKGRPRRRRLARQRFTGLPFNKMIPNILTLLALCAGMTAIRFAYLERWEPAAVAILAAAILDGLDGRVARILKGSSKFGAELDSLSDFVSFGVAPAMILYFWTMQGAGGFGWVLVLLFAVCCALRLARFNTALEEPDLPPWAFNFFTGVPSPAGAGLVLLPLILSFEVGDEYLRRPEVAGFFLVVVGGLLVSRIQTFSFKKVKVPHTWVLPFMVLVGLMAASIVTMPWVTLAVILSAYLISIPFSIRAFAVLKRKAEEIQGGGETPGDVQPPEDGPEGGASKA